MLGVQRYFPVSGATLAAEPIDEATVGDRDQPWCKRPGRIVGLPNGMDGQQDVLHCVFNVTAIRGPRCGKGAKIPRDLLQQPMIGGSVALLSAGHQDGPIDIPGDRCRSVYPAAVVFPDEPQRRSAAAWVMRH